MSTLEHALALVFEPHNLLVMLLAGAFGLFVGAMPGLTATMATALLVPVTFFMPPVPAIASIVMDLPRPKFRSYEIGKE